jgi:phage shock protein E
MKLRSVHILLVILVIGAGYYLYDLAVNSKHRVSAETAKQLIKNGKIAVVLDVRTNLERETLGSYPGSVHIQSADLETMMPIQYPNKDIGIVVYCNTGHRARLATDKLHTMGYKNSVYVTGGPASIA